MPQKRFKTKVLESVSPERLDDVSGFEEVSLGEFRGILASVGEEGEFFTLTGIAPEIASGGPQAEAVVTSGGGSKSKNKKRILELYALTITINGYTLIGSQLNWFEQHLLLCVECNMVKH